jgi:hypothetical protein
MPHGGVNLLIMPHAVQEAELRPNTVWQSKYFNISVCCPHGILETHQHILGGIPMTGEERRVKILSMMRETGDPIPGAALAKGCQVSRQIIVQDIALLRAAKYQIVSTPRGYQLVEEAKSVAAAANSGCYRVYHVSHTDEQIEDELNTIVDNGGRVLDVFVEHEIYGSIRAELKVQCRRHVQEFLEEIRSGKSSPLKNLTHGTHYHTVEGDSEETLDIIEQELKKKGYLL